MFKTLQAKVLGVIFIILLIVVGVLGFLWQSEKAITALTKTQMANLEKEQAQALTAATAEINRLNTDNANLSLKYEQEINLANQRHKEVVNEINAKHRADLVANERLRNTISTLNTKLSSLSESSRKDYAITAGNNLAECSGVTVELERLARSYSAEIDFLLEAWPKTNPDK